MDHAALMLDPTYAAWPELRQEDHRALCMAAYHYAMVTYQAGPIMDVMCALLAAEPIPNDAPAGTGVLGARNRECIAREVLALPTRRLGERPALQPSSWDGERGTVADVPGPRPQTATDALSALDRAVADRDEQRMADALAGRVAVRAAVRVSGSAAADLGVADGTVIGHAPRPELLHEPRRVRIDRLFPADRDGYVGGTPTQWIDRGGARP